jgi:hypothetical protein
VVAIVWGIIKARQEREALAALARELGLAFYPDDPWALPDRYGHFGLFSKGHSRAASNVLSGNVDGHGLVAFDYRYKTGSGKDETTHSYQAAVMGLPILAPQLLLRDESLLDAVASWIGHDDLDFESDEFSRKYYVKCAERKFAYDIFHARLIEYLLASGHSPSIEMNGPLVVLYERPNGAPGIRRLIEIGRHVVESIPEYVLNERGTAPPGAGP